MSTPLNIPASTSSSKANAKSSKTNVKRSREEVVQRYELDQAALEGEIRHYSLRSGMLSTARGALLLTTLVVFAWGWFQWGSGWWIPGVIVATAFFVVASIQENSERHLWNARTKLLIINRSLAAMARDFKKLAPARIAVSEERAAVARDLDLIGPNSLYRLLGQAQTPMGQATLRDWLILTPELEDVHHRQEAVRSLIGERAWREQLQLVAEQLSASKSGPDSLIAWAESKPWLTARPWLKWIARVLTASAILLILLLMLGAIDKQIGGIGLIVVGVLNFALSVAFAGTIHPLFNQVSSKQNDVAHYRKLFAMLQELPQEGEFWKEIHDETSFAGHPAFHQIVQLGNIMVMANLRRSGLFGIIYLILQFIVLWDFHALDILEAWQKRCATHVRSWFNALGKVEAITCLAKLAHDEPDWVFPKVVPFEAKQVRLEAKQLGHPLIADEHRVPNDTIVGPAGSVLLVTGSNMSGKSTHLRALGVNIALAQAGTVVCAQSMKTPLVHVETSMRISDSLSDGVSFFMAELNRLKEIVDLAGQVSEKDGVGFFYLLDEILQGTNSRERHIAVQEVIRHLIEVNAIGAVSTHDLELATAEGLIENCVPVHFRETIDLQAGGRKMTFDYRLREGVSTTTNALKLLELVGLRSAEPPHKPVEPKS